MRPSMSLRVCRIGCLEPTCQTVKCNSVLATFMTGEDRMVITRVIVYTHAARKGHAFNNKRLCNCVTKVKAIVNASIFAVVPS